MKFYFIGEIFKWKREKKSQLKINFDDCIRQKASAKLTILLILNKEVINSLYIITDQGIKIEIHFVRTNLLLEHV